MGAFASPPVRVGELWLFQETVRELSSAPWSRSPLEIARAAVEHSLSRMAELPQGLLTQHALMVAWGEFADEIGLLEENFWRMVQSLREKAQIARQIALGDLAGAVVPPACATSAFVSRSGLLLTTYKAIRGADRVQVELSGGRQVSDEVRVAAYDVSTDLAVLQVPTIRSDSLGLTTSVSGGQAVWGFGFAMCTATAGRDVQLSVTGATPAAPSARFWISKAEILIRASPEEML